MSPVSAEYWNISGYVIFWSLFAVAFGLFARRIYFLTSLLRLGRGEERFDRLMYRTKSMLLETVFQWCSLKTVSLNRKELNGIAHAMLVSGFGLFIVGYIIFIGFGGGFGLSAALSGSRFETVYFTVMDIAGVFLILAIVWVVIKRYLIRPERLEASTKTAGGLLMLLLASMFMLVLLHYCMEGFVYAAYATPGSRSYIGAILADYLVGTGISENARLALYRGTWWFNYVLILGFLVYAPYSKHLHPLASPFNVFFKSLGPKGALKPLKLDGARTFGVSKIQDFTWKHLLDLYSCTECGRCHENCPAQISGKSLDPREVVLDLKKHLLEIGPGLLKAKGRAETCVTNHRSTITGGLISKDAIWACLDCGACQEVCPANIEQMAKLTEMKRNLVLEQASIPRTGEEALKSIEADGHPWRGTGSGRTDWARGLSIRSLAEDSDIDILYWVGCTSALEERSAKVAAALARVLQQAGVNFGILGDEESCCGDPARHLGSEYLYQLQAEKNISLLKSYGVKRIVTGCPHCYNTLKHEYPHFGGDFEVVHHTEFIDKLMQEDKLVIAEGASATMAYHDACYLGRFNGVFEPPRQVLKKVPGINLVEMAKNRERSFCCGAGGGHLWLEEQRGFQRINEIRTNQALDTGAEVVATACPYCLQMFEDGIKAKETGKSLVIMDIAEVVARSLM